MMPVIEQKFTFIGDQDVIDQHPDVVAEIKKQCDQLPPSTIRIHVSPRDPVKNRLEWELNVSNHHGRKTYEVVQTKPFGHIGFVQRTNND